MTPVGREKGMSSLLNSDLVCGMRDPGMVHPRPGHRLTSCEPLIAFLVPWLVSEAFRDGNGQPPTSLICLVVTCSPLPARDMEHVEGDTCTFHARSNMAVGIHWTLCVARVWNRQKDEVSKLPSDYCLSRSPLWQSTFKPCIMRGCPG